MGGLNNSEGRSSGPRDGRAFPTSTDNIGEGIQRVLQSIAKYELPVRSGEKVFKSIRLFTGKENCLTAGVYFIPWLNPWVSMHVNYYEQKQKDFELYHGNFSRRVFWPDDIWLLQGVQQR